MSDLRRHIAAVTVARSDYGIYRPVLRAIRRLPDMRVSLVVSGAHLSADLGLTVREIEAEGMPIAERVPMLSDTDTPEAIAESMGRGIAGFGRAYARLRPDLLLVLGDRFEMHAAASAAVPMSVPIAHIHGGEITEGAIDDVFRHSITKMSHLHFVSTEQAARRVAQMGEEPWRITVSGAPGLDGLRDAARLDRAEIAARFGVRLPETFLLATFHPVTLELNRTAWQIDQLVHALERVAIPVVFTMPNADSNGRLIRERIARFVQAYPWASRVENFGTEGYASAMSLASAMVGNSSSGILEAATFELPVVNTGARQAGRERAANIIDVGDSADEIVAGLRRSLDPAFRAGLRGLRNPYGDGRASERIAERLTTVAFDDRFRRKRFAELPPSGRSAASFEARASCLA